MVLVFVPCILRFGGLVASHQASMALGLTLDGTGGIDVCFVVGFWLPVLGSDKV